MAIAMSPMMPRPTSRAEEMGISHVADVARVGMHKAGNQMAMDSLSPKESMEAPQDGVPLLRTSGTMELNGSGHSTRVESFGHFEADGQNMAQHRWNRDRADLSTQPEPTLPPSLFPVEILSADRNATNPSTNGHARELKTPTSTFPSDGNVLRANFHSSYAGPELKGIRGTKLELLLQDPFRWTDFVEPEKAEEDVPGHVPPPSPRRKKRKAQDEDEVTGDKSKASASSPVVNGHAATHPSASGSSSVLYPHDPRTVRPANIVGKREVAAGLHNLGNTCYQNSVIQVLMHTPPVMEFLQGHQRLGVCPTFCLACDLKQTLEGVWRGNKPHAMINMNRNIKRICQTMRAGRQEDAHEFLRYVIDNLQDAELRGYGKAKASHSIKETTLIHKSYGGKLRSRVRCLKCGHNSDTFDTFMDLSVDVGGDATNLDQCLARIAQTDRLFGKNKYKCEKCKTLVDAEKTVRIVRLPPILSIHLKRFTATGRKITGNIRYGDQLRIPAKALDGTSISYDLYGVVCHQGSGPHLGHYYSLIRGSTGKWVEMNDETRSILKSSADRSAYILHYVQSKGSKLEAAVREPIAAGTHGVVPPRRNFNGGLDRDLDVGVPEPHAHGQHAQAGPSNYQEIAQGARNSEPSQKSPTMSPRTAREARDEGPPPWPGTMLDERISKKPKYTPIGPGSFYDNPESHRNASNNHRPDWEVSDRQHLPKQFGKGKDKRRVEKHGAANVRNHGSPYDVGGRGGRGGGHLGGRGNSQKAKDRMQPRQ